MFLNLNNNLSSFYTRKLSQYHITNITMQTAQLLKVMIEYDKLIIYIMIWDILL